MSQASKFYIAFTIALILLSLIQVSQSSLKGTENNEKVKIEFCNCKENETCCVDQASVTGVTCYEGLDLQCRG